MRHSQDASPCPVPAARCQYPESTPTVDLDLRLARYFRMSEGFFLGLQDDYELLEAKRALNDELDKFSRAQHQS